MNSTHHDEGLVDPKVHVFQNTLETVLERIKSKNETFQKDRKKSICGQFLPILATFYKLNSHFKKSW
jgi:hypothetical protein